MPKKTPKPSFLAGHYFSYFAAVCWAGLALARAIEGEYQYMLLCGLLSLTQLELAEHRKATNERTRDRV